jgi:hypothetical protein
MPLIVLWLMTLAARNRELSAATTFVFAGHRGYSAFGSDNSTQLPGYRQHGIAAEHRSGCFVSNSLDGFDARTHQ